MAAKNPRAPTRKQLSAIFRKQFQNLDKEDKRLIKAFEQLFEIVPDEIDASIDELFESLFSWLGPAVNAGFGKAFEQGKEIRDIVEEIATDRIAIAAVSGNLGEFKKVVADQAAFISELIATVGRLNGKLGELAKPRPIRFESAAYQILINDLGVSGDASGGAFPVTMSDPTKNTGKTYFLSNTGGTGTMTILPFGSEKLGGKSSLSVPSTPIHTTIKLTSDGTNYLTA